MKKICTEVSCEYFIPYKHCKAEKCVKKQTNADKIRAMTDEELGIWLSENANGNSAIGWTLWLKQEATE